jgi:hypothetical protein
MSIRCVPHVHHRRSITFRQPLNCTVLGTTEGKPLYLMYVPGTVCLRGGTRYRTCTVPTGTWVTQSLMNNQQHQQTPFIVDYYYYYYY